MNLYKYILTSILLLGASGIVHSQKSYLEFSPSSCFSMAPLSSDVQKIFSDTIQEITSIFPHHKDKSRKLHIKTNLLGLGLGIANVAAEIDLAKHWSFALPIYYSSWDYFKTTIKFRTFSVQPEFRYWLSKNNDGFFVGVHFGLAYYNFALDGDYRYQDHNQETPAMGGGMSLGYRFPISQNNRFRMEFSLGAGYYPLHYDKFRNISNAKEGLMVENLKKDYLNLDQVTISFSYAFDLKKKGGKR